MKTLVFIPLMLGALYASADCSITVPRQEPAVPDGIASSEQDMLIARDATQTYVNAIERVLECRGEFMTAVGHDMLVDKAHRAATLYNAELRRFLERGELASR